MRSRKLALVIAPFLLLSLLPGVVTAAQPKDTKAAHHAKVVKYWTPERIKNAKPRDFVFDPAKGTLQARREARPAQRRRLRHRCVLEAAGDILNGTGRVLFTLGGSDYICSGSVVAESNTGRSIVLTAGHCASRERRHDQGDELDVHPVVRHVAELHMREHAVRVLGRRCDLR